MIYAYYIRVKSIISWIRNFMLNLFIILEVISVAELNAALCLVTKLRKIKI